MLEELQRYINNKFCVLAAKVKAYVDEKTSGSSGSISQEDIDNWDAAYAASQTLATTYFPLTGGGLTGTGGAGFVGFQNQSPVPTAPANGFRMYSDNTGRINFVGANGFVLSFSPAGLTASRVFTFPDIAGTFVLDTGDQTIAGLKSFSGATTTFGGNIAFSASNRNIATTGQPVNAMYVGQVLGIAHMLVGSQAALASGSLRFVLGGVATYVGGFQTITGNFYAQNSSGTIVTDNGAGVQFSHSKTAASGLARGMSLVNTLTAAANNDVLVALDISTTFTNGAFTGVGNLALRTNAGISIGGNITFDADATRNIGGNGGRVANIFAANFAKGSTAGGMNFILTNSSTDTFARFHSTSNNFVLQASGAIPTDTGERLQVQGNTLLNGGVKSKVTSSAAATVSMDANSKIWVFTGTTSTYTLPVIAGNTGLELVIINKGSGAITLNANGGTSDIYDAGANTASISIDAGTTQMIFHDGTKYATM